MMEANRFYRESDHFRAWIDGPGAGSIRIIKRVNFRALVRLFREMLTEMKKDSPGNAHITFYISRSLNDEMSDNALEFLDFCKACMGVDIELVILE